MARQYKGNLLLLLTAMIWGSALVAQSVSMDLIGPFTFQCMRSILGSLVLLPVICAFLTDAGAYFAGVFLGKHRGITKVSPNKSLEGYIGGILSGGIFLLLYGIILQQFAGLTVSLPIMAVYGLIGSAVTEVGDLSFSLIKRQFSIKDYGNLLPGHGGMLDRFDSMTFAAPTLLILVSLIPAF